MKPTTGRDRKYGGDCMETVFVCVCVCKRDNFFLLFAFKMRVLYFNVFSLSKLYAPLLHIFAEERENCYMPSVTTFIDLIILAVRL